MGILLHFLNMEKKNTGKDLPKAINEKIEKILNLEMKELGYL